MPDTIAFSDTQLQKLIGAVEALKASGFHWEAIVPVFVGSVLGFGLALVLEYLKNPSRAEKEVIRKPKKGIDRNKHRNDRVGLQFGNSHPLCFSKHPAALR